MPETPQFPDEHEFTTAEFEERLDGRDFQPVKPNERHFECDWCSRGVPYTAGKRIAMYYADGVVGNVTEKARYINEERPLVPMASYCEECSYKRLLFPCEGYTEVRVFVTIDEEKIHKKPEVTDISGQDDGIPWDPAELSEEVTGVPYAQNAIIAGGDILMAPENIVTFFLAFGDGIDIRDLVRWDGSLDPKILGQARRKYREVGEKLRDQGKQGFKNHVQN